MVNYARENIQVKKVRINFVQINMQAQKWIGRCVYPWRWTNLAGGECEYRPMCFFPLPQTVDILPLRYTYTDAIMSFVRVYDY
jgi:hypothetical protein